jgi:hypothetical protein
MKKTIYLLCLLAGAVFTSCEDESSYNNPVHNDLEKGAVVRFSSLPPTSFQPEEAQTIAIQNEIYSPDNNVSKYELSVKANIVSLGQSYVAENILTVTSFPSNLNLTSQLIADAIGVDASSFGAGDIIEFSAVVTRNDGTKFYPVTPSLDDDTGVLSIGNTDANLLNVPAYTTAMKFSYVLACPIEDDLYVGDYMLVNTIPAPCGGEVFLEQIVTLEKLSVYQRTFDAIYLEQFAIGNGPMTFTINFICGEVSGADNMGTGLQCANGISLNASDVPGGYSDTEDLELIVNFQEDCSDCGAPAEFETSLTLTKIN